ncbi:MAG TPA: universal stress protein [Candidatus Solibacter sp.]|jgi:nucleotide-binding universal stress UspA family protein|nr:universal stress protein [Candidatus Solibacter sp.]
MYKNILIPTDGSELAGKAVEHGIALAKDIGAKITVLTATAPFRIVTFEMQMLEDTPDQYKKNMHDYALKILGVVAGAAKAAGVACDTVHAEQEHPYQAIIDTAKLKGCDLIVMALHGPPRNLGNCPWQLNGQRCSRTPKFQFSFTANPAVRNVGPRLWPRQYLLSPVVDPYSDAVRARKHPGNLIDA